MGSLLGGGGHDVQSHAVGVGDVSGDEVDTRFYDGAGEGDVVGLSGRACDQEDGFAAAGVVKGCFELGAVLLVAGFDLGEVGGDGEVSAMGEGGLTLLGSGHSVVGEGIGHRLGGVLQLMGGHG